MAPPSVTKRTMVSPLNAKWLFIALAILIVLLSCAFVILTYVTSLKHPHLSIGPVLAVMIGGLIVSIILAFLFPNVKGSQANVIKEMSIPWHLILPYSSMLVIAVWSFTMYGKYGKEMDEDSKSDKGGAAQRVLAWCMMFASIIAFLGTLSIGPDITKGIAWLILPFIAGAFVSIGTIWVQVRYLTTDG